MPNDVRLIDANALDQTISEEAAFKLKQAYRRDSSAEARGLIWAKGMLNDAPTVDPIRKENCDGCYYLGSYGPKPCGNCKRNPNMPDHFDARGDDEAE